MNQTKNIGFSYIIEMVAERILDGEYTEGQRIPSVREMAVLMQVAPNTVVHAYERLGAQGLIHTQRGIGFFVSPGALELVRQQRRRLFHEETIPRLKRIVAQLGITDEELRQELGL